MPKVELPNDHLTYSAQELTEEQKAQARENIGAICEEDIPEVPEQVQADWNQNDPEGDGYIKGRTHYVTTEKRTMVDAESPYGETDMDMGAVEYLRRHDNNGELLLASGSTYYYKLGDSEGTFVLPDLDAVEGEKWEHYIGDHLFIRVRTITDYFYPKGAWFVVCNSFSVGPNYLNIPFYFAEIVESVNVLDEKYIPASIARASQIPEVSTPDWNASEGEAGYVANRTHYVTYEKYYATELEDLTFSGKDASGLTMSGYLKKDTEYIVELDGEKYAVMSEIADGYGSVRIGSSNCTEYPFYIYFGMESGNYDWIKVSTDGDHVLSVYTLTEEAVPLDEKFIPDTIARVERVFTYTAEMADDGTPTWSADFTGEELYTAMSTGVFPKVVCKMYSGENLVIFSMVSSISLAGNDVMASFHQDGGCYSVYVNRNTNDITYTSRTFATT